MSKSPAPRKAAPKPSVATKAASNKAPKPSRSPAPGKRAGATSPQISKTAACLELLRQDEGASLQELMSATGWQAHSVRGFLSGTVKKKLGLPLASSGGEGDVRRYRITPNGE
jgi:hypothetical protein